MSNDRPGEFDLIKRYFAPLAKDPGSLGLTDDAAVLSPRAGFDLVLTKDVLAAGVHFFPHDAPEAIAAKALRVNLSDLAAKGARPRGYLMGLALHADWTTDWLDRFCKGLAADQAAFEVTLLGGDTIRSDNGLQISITALGEVKKDKAVRRSGAKPGDVLFVSGTIGDAAAGLKARLDGEFCRSMKLTESEERHIHERYLLPRPRTCLSDPLSRYANAAMDISDGLFADGKHMAIASSVDLAIDLDRVPLSGALRRVNSNNRLAWLDCLNGGDDYEILASVPEEKSGVFVQEAADSDCPVTRIGRVERGRGALTVYEANSPVNLKAEAGFSHF
ncbi:Thiamine-monophosphate kinase [Roseibium album]|nr:Thiamine-monophosphate kinase [Roseibium album]